MGGKNTKGLLAGPKRNELFVVLMTWSSVTMQTFQKTKAAHFLLGCVHAKVLRCFSLFVSDHKQCLHKNFIICAFD